MRMDSSRPTVYVGRRLCPHCEQTISVKTFKVHKRRYFNETTNSWVKTDKSSAPTAIGNPNGNYPRINRSESPPSVVPRHQSAGTDGFTDVSSASEDENEPDSEEVWESFTEEDIRNDFSDEVPPSLNIQTQVPTSLSILCVWLVTFLVNLQVVFSLPDIVLDAILKFLSAFFLVLRIAAPGCSEIAKNFPCSIYRLKTYMGISQTVKTSKFVACRKCHQIYPFNNCIQGRGLTLQSKLCSFCKFPFHPHQRMREQCGKLLLKTVELSSGRKVFYPFMTYCYLGLQGNLDTFLRNRNFLDCIDHWKSIDLTSDNLCDVYHGKVWSDFQIYDNKPFLSDPYCFGLMLNVDWFRPYKHVMNYSIGAIYIVFMNLPRHLRFKRQNVLLIGILPGPSEPPHDINSYLRPLVDELLQLWTGMNMVVHGQNTQKLIRCALLSVSCDIPAGRKTCGFPGHSAKLGCSRCAKLFGGSFGNIDYSGFDRMNWPSRCVSDHRTAIQQLRQCTSKSQRICIESATGYHDSILLDLPYFDSVRMLLVDPMHNLFLGTAKTILKKVWIERDIISQHFDLIQKRIDKCRVPSDIGRIPYKILSGFTSFTADQFKNWVVYYSLLVLHDILVDDHLECWRHFVLACRILTQYEIRKNKVALADALLLQFCNRVERLYGGSIITPNMHFQCHIKDCVLDYGPLHGFWCFSFERYNGLLGEIPTNNRSVEVQVMNRFVRDNSFLSSVLPREFEDTFKDLIPHEAVVGSLLDSITKCTLSVSADACTLYDSVIATSVDISFPKVCSRHLFTAREITGMNFLYSKIYSVSELSISVNASHLRYSTLKVRDKQLGSHMSISASSSIIMAMWIPSLFGSSDSEADHETKPAQINYFARHSININDETHTLTVVSLSWFKPHCRKHYYGKPITVWECDLFEPEGCYSILPIQFVSSRTVSLVDTVNPTGSHALFVCPCVEF